MPEASPQAEYYEEYWSAEGWRPLQGSVIDDRVQRLFEAAVRPGARCLDFGCGSAAMTAPMIRELGGTYLGVDVSANAVTLARRAGFDAEQVEPDRPLPFDDDSFDFVCAIEVIEHLLDPLKALADVRRVLRPEGKIVLTCPNTTYWRRRADSLAGRWNPMGDDRSVKEPWRDPHVRFFTLKTLKGLIDAASFDIVASGGHGGGLLRSLPGARRLSRGRTSAAYRWLEGRVSPALLGARLYVLAEPKAGAPELMPR